MKCLLLLILCISYGFTKEYQRIVSLYGGFTEIFSALGAEDHIVGATFREAQRLQVSSVGNHMAPSIEAIMRCNPDMVIAYGSDPKRFIRIEKHLKKRGIPFVVYMPQRVDDVLFLIQKFGKETATEEKAQEIIATIQRDLSFVDEALKKEEKRKSLFFEVRGTPHLLTAGKEAIALDIIRRAGGVPVATQKGVVCKTTKEAVLLAKPDFYLQQQGIMNKNPTDLQSDPILSKLPAVKSGAYTTINQNIISRPSINIGKAVKEVYGALYGK